jgi:hypothetical protein
MVRRLLTFRTPVKNTLTRYFDNKEIHFRISTGYYSYRINILIEAYFVIREVNANKVNFSMHRQ